MEHARKPSSDMRRRELYESGTNPFYLSPEWRRLRAAVLRRDGYKDMWLARYGRHVPAETVHHVFLLDERPDLARDPRNLVSVSLYTHRHVLHNPDGSLTGAGEDLQRVIARRFPELVQAPAG